MLTPKQAYARRRQLKAMLAVAHSAETAAELAKIERAITRFENRRAFDADHAARMRHARELAGAY